MRIIYAMVILNRELNSFLDDTALCYVQSSHGSWKSVRRPFYGILLRKKLNLSISFLQKE